MKDIHVVFPKFMTKVCVMQYFTITSVTEIECV